MGTHPIFESDFDCLTESSIVFDFKRRPKKLFRKSAYRDELKKCLIQKYKIWIEETVRWRIAQKKRAIEPEYLSQVLIGQMSSGQMLSNHLVGMMQSTLILLVITWTLCL